MYAYLLVGFLCASLHANPDQLIAELEADFATLIKAERDPQPIRRAARLLEETNNSDRWSSYREAVFLIRQTRSKAAIPLLLRYMIVHSSSSSHGGSIDEYADTLTILTGTDIPSPYRYVPDRGPPVREAVQELVKDWWNPNKKNLTTDLGKMSREQMQVVVHRLLRCVDWRFENDVNGSILELSENLRDVLMREPDKRPSILAQDLHPSMIPILLDLCGYQENESEGPSIAQADKISFSIVSMLAELRRRNRSLILEKVSEDRNQNSVVRLTCVLSLVSAGGALRTKEVLDIVQNEPNEDLRVIAVLALGYSLDRRVAMAELNRLLDDPNLDVRAAAQIALKPVGR